MERRCGRCRAALPPDDWVSPPIPTRISSNSSKIVGDRAVKAAALAELRRAYADASAIAELVDFVEQVHNIETSTSIHRKTADTNTATKARAAGQLFIACEFLAAGWIPQLFF